MKDWGGNNLITKHRIQNLLTSFTSDRQEAPGVIKSCLEEFFTQSLSLRSISPFQTFGKIANALTESHQEGQ